MHSWIAVLAAAALLTGSSGWSGFRNGGNQSMEAQGYPVEWAPGKNLAWQVALPGYGQSAPVVANGRVYVTAVPGRTREHYLVLCLNAATGRQLWERRLPAAFPADLHDMVSRAAPTPIVEGEALYVMFESGDLLRLHTATGQPVWHRSLFREFGEFRNGHGYGSSPTHTRDALVVLVDHQGPSYLLAVDKRTGAVRWKADRSERPSWTSPVVTRVGAREVIVVSSTGDVCGYDAADGTELFRFEGLTGNHIPSPVAQGERIYVGAAIPRGNRRAPGARTPAESNLALHLAEQQGRLVPQLAWQGAGALCEYGSPTLHRGLLYYVNSAGVLFCVDAASGTQLYAERVEGPCWVSPVAVGDHLYLFGRGGTTTVVRAGRSFQRVASNRLWEPGNEPRPAVDYSPPRREGPAAGAPGGQPGEGRGGGGAPAGPLDPCIYGVAAAEGRFFIRSGTHLYCVARR